MLLSTYTICVKYRNFHIYPKCCIHTEGTEISALKEKQEYLKSQIIQNLILVTQMILSHIQSPPTQNVIDLLAGFFYPSE